MYRRGVIVVIVRAVLVGVMVCHVVNAREPGPRYTITGQHISVRAVGAVDMPRAIESKIDEVGRSHQQAAAGNQNAVQHERTGIVQHRDTQDQQQQTG